MKEKIEMRKRIRKIGAIVVIGLFLAVSLVSPVSATDTLGEDDTFVTVEDPPVGGDGIITWEEDGTEYMRLTDHKLGIGDTTPDFKLEVAASLGSGYFGVTSSSDGDIFVIKGDGKVGIGTPTPGSALEIKSSYYTSETSALHVKNSQDTSLFFVRDDGNVGIGVINPAEKLEINGNVLFNYGSDRNIKVEKPPTKETNGYDLTIEAGDAYYGGAGMLGNAGGFLKLIGGDGDGGTGGGGGRVYIYGGLASYGNDDGDVILAYTGAAARGEVGIGTEGPTQLLDVNGKIEIGDDANTATAGAMRWTGFHFQGYNGLAWVPLDVQTTSGGGWTDDGTVVRLTTITDNVGIGTASPNAKLDVRGTAIFNDGSGDYDFRIESDGNENMFFVDASNNNIGIGTASPGALLELAITSGDPDLRFDIGGTDKFTIGVDDSDGDKFKIGTTAIDTNTRLTIDSNGNVGIGDDTPDRILHIKDTSNPPLKYECTTDATIRTLQTYIPIDVNGDIYYIRIYQ